MTLFWSYANLRCCHRATLSPIEDSPQVLWGGVAVAGQACPCLLYVLVCVTEWRVGVGVISTYQWCSSYGTYLWESEACLCGQMSLWLHCGTLAIQVSCPLVHCCTPGSKWTSMTQRNQAVLEACPATHIWHTVTQYHGWGKQIFHLIHAGDKEGKGNS